MPEWCKSSELHEPLGSQGSSKSSSRWFVSIVSPSPGPEHSDPAAESERKESEPGSEFATEASGLDVSETLDSVSQWWLAKCRLRLRRCSNLTCR